MESLRWLKLGRAERERKPSRSLCNVTLKVKLDHRRHYCQASLSFTTLGDCPCQECEIDSIPVGACWDKGTPGLALTQIWDLVPARFLVRQMKGESPVCGLNYLRWYVWGPSRESSSGLLNQGSFLSPQDIWGCLETRWGNKTSVGEGLLASSG